MRSYNSTAFLCQVIWLMNGSQWRVYAMIFWLTDESKTICYAVACKTCQISNEKTSNENSKIKSHLLVHLITTWHRSCHALPVLYWREKKSGAIVFNCCLWKVLEIKTMSTLTSIARSTSVLQRAVSQRKSTSLIRSFSPTAASFNAPQKLTVGEVAASVRLLTYQGTPFPWVTVSDDCVHRCAWKS